MMKNKYRWLFWSVVFWGMGCVEGQQKQCANDGFCEADWFCLKAFGQMRMGKCEPCWSCCVFGKDLLGGMFDGAGCPSKCRCEEGRTCFAEESAPVEMKCGGGMVCAEADGGGIGVCREPSLGDSVFQQVASLYRLFLNDSSGGMEVGGLEAFSVEQGCRGGSGCPCNSTEGAVGYMCAAGHRCVPSGAATNPGALGRLLRPMETVFGHTCERCHVGEYCPEGTVGREERLCPRGHYCPDPGTMRACSEGEFCSAGVVAPQSCDYERLLMKNVYVLRERDTVVDRLTRYGDAFKGNYCPANATTPAMVCAEGFYCPNASVSLECPVGSFCKGGTVVPRTCPILSSCPRGSIAPGVTGLPFLFAGAVLLVIACVKLVRWWLMRDRKLVSVVMPIFSNVAVMNDEDDLRKAEEYLEDLMREDDENDGGRNSDFLGLDEGVNDGGVGAGVLSEFKKYVRPAQYIAVRDISARSGPRKEPWLWNNSVRFPCQRMSAIMGASGCGKSVTLDLMRGRVPKGAWVTGSVHVRMRDGERADLNLEDLERGGGGFEISKLQSFVGFVPQDDIVHGDLTVWENMLFSALIKLPALGRAERHRLVEAVVDALKLSKISGSLVGSVDRRGISGGQRKRVNVGVEMVGLPSVLVMDEPTSGLDATMTWEFLKVCKDLTELGLTVLCVIHQPRYTAYTMFDHVLLLTKYGSVFCGSPCMSIAYFKHGLGEALDVNENPADVLIDLIGKRQEDMSRTWRTRGWRWVKECRQMYPLLDDALRMDVRWTAGVERVLSAALDRACGEDGDEGVCEEALMKGLGVPVEETFAGRKDEKKKIGREELLRRARFVCETAWLERAYGNIIERADLLEGMIMRHVFRTKEDEGRHVRATAVAMRFGRRLMRRAGIETKSVAKREGWEGDKRVLLMVMNVKAMMHQREAGGRMGWRQGGEEEDGAVEFFVLSAMRTWGQIPTVMRRKLLSLWRSPWPIQVLIPVVAAFIIGGIHGAGWGLRGYPSNVVMAMACLGVLSAVTHVRTYAMDRAIVRRETDGPLSISAYTLSYASVDTIWLFLMPALFVVPYYHFMLPETSFWVIYCVGLMVCWWNSGMAYVVSALPLGLQWVNLIAVFVSVIFGAFIHGLSPTVSEVRGGVMEWVLGISYNRWAMEVLALHEMEHHRHVAGNQVWLLMSKLGVCGEKAFDGDGLKGASGAVSLLRRMRRIQEKSLVEDCGEYIRNAFAALAAWGVVFRVICYLIIVMDGNTVVQRTLWRARVRIFR